MSLVYSARALGKGGGQRDLFAAPSVPDNHDSGMFTALWEAPSYVGSSEVPASLQPGCRHVTQATPIRNTRVLLWKGVKTPPPPAGAAQKRPLQSQQGPRCQLQCPFPFPGLLGRLAMSGTA